MELNMSKIDAEIMRVRAASKFVKDSKNPHFKNTYASLKAAINCLDYAITELGSELTYRGVNVLIDGVLYKKVSVFFEDETVDNLVPLINEKKNMQGFGSADTYSFRYGVTGIFGLIAEEDDDGHNASEKYSKAPVEQAKKFIEKNAPSFSISNDKPKNGKSNYKQWNEIFELVRAKKIPFVENVKELKFEDAEKIIAGAK